jgi:hypothetical protein
MFYVDLGPVVIPLPLPDYLFLIAFPTKVTKQSVKKQAIVEKTTSKSG